LGSNWKARAPLALQVHWKAIALTNKQYDRSVGSQVLGLEIFVVQDWVANRVSRE